MNAEKTDHEIDIEFGQWLRDMRTRCKLSVEQAAKSTSLSVERIKSLELGYAEKGITKQESQKICAAYKIGLEEFLDRAAGNK